MGEGRGAEGERAGRGESKVNFSSSPFLVVRAVDSPGGKFSPPQRPPPIMALTLSGSSACSRPPRRGLTDYTLRVNAHKTQPSALRISPPDLERTPEPELLRILRLGSLCITPSKSLSRILILTLIYVFVIMVQLHMHLSPDFHTQPQSKKDWRQFLKFQRGNCFDQSDFPTAPPPSQTAVSTAANRVLSSLVVRQHTKHL